MKLLAVQQALPAPLMAAAKVNNNNANAGIFSTVGNGGVVKNVNIYSGNFTGTDNAGAVAGVNNGRIENIVTFGNTVTSDGNAGGIVGINSSGTFKEVGDGNTNGGELSNGIYDVESTGSVIAGSDSAIAGGLVGTNDGGLANSFSDSAVTVKPGVTLDDKKTTALGGVVGVNEGDVQMVDSLGVTNGGSTGSSNVGGVIGINKGNMYSGYNESTSVTIAVRLQMLLTQQVLLVKIRTRIMLANMLAGLLVTIMVMLITAEIMALLRELNM